MVEGDRPPERKIPDVGLSSSHTVGFHLGSGGSGALPSPYLLLWQWVCQNGSAPGNAQHKLSFLRAELPF